MSGGNSDSFRHLYALRALHRLDRLVVRQKVRECGKSDDAYQRAEENEYRGLGCLRHRFVQGRRGLAVDIRPLHGIGYLRLELGVLVQILAAFVGTSGSRHQTAEAGGYIDHQDLRDRDVKTVGIADRYKSHDGGGDRRTSDTYLRRHTRHGTRTLRTNTLAQRDVADNRHHHIHHVPCPAKDGERESSQRGEKRDTVRVLA